jgi:SH3 domain protein
MRLKLWSAAMGVVFLLAGLPSLHAETQFVTDNVKLTVRTGPSVENKIIAVIETGTTVDVITPGENWSLVRIPDGKEGYVLSRYLVADPPSVIQLERLQSRHQELSAEADALREENRMLKTETEQLRSELTTLQQDLNRTDSEFEALKRESAGFLELKEKYDRAASELSQKTGRVEKLEKELGQLEISQYIRWFLAGSGVLLVGFILGFSVKRQRRRSSLY